MYQIWELCAEAAQMICGYCGNAERSLSSTASSYVRCVDAVVIKDLHSADAARTAWILRDFSIFFSHPRISFFFTRILPQPYQNSGVLYFFFFEIFWIFFHILECDSEFYRNHIKIQTLSLPAKRPTIASCPLHVICCLIV